MPTTIADLFYAALRHDLPDALASRMDGAYRPLSSGEVQARVERLCLALRRNGLAAGDRVAILAENRPEWAMADFACALLGLVTAPVYPTLNPAQTAQIIRHSGARMIFCSTPAQLDKVLAVWPELLELETAVLMAGAVPAQTGRRILAWEELQAAGRALEDQRPMVRAWARERSAGDLLTLIYTSGTTGEPKGAMLTHGNLVSNIQSALELLPIHAGRRCLSFLPLSHIFERMAGHYTMFSAGVAIYYAEDLAALPQAFLEVRPQVLIAVPRVYEKIYAKVRDSVAEGGFLKRMVFHWAMEAGREVAQCRFAGRKPGALLGLRYRLADKLVFAKVRARLGGRVELSASGGAPLGPKLMEFFWAAGVSVYEGYGLSETSPILAVSRPGEVCPGYVGRPILEQWQGRPFLKLAEDGEILCQGPNITRGYWNDPRATAEAFDAEGYFRTGDIGGLDGQGRLRITDRKKELLVTSAGKNVAPQPLEKLLVADKYIAQVVVIGDARHYLTAVVYPNLGTLRLWMARQGLSSLSDAELLAHPRTGTKLMQRVERINAQLSNFERIRKVALIGEEMTLENGLLTPSLKIKRRAVNEKYGQAIEAMYAQGAEPDPSSRVALAVVAEDGRLAGRTSLPSPARS